MIYSRPAESFDAWLTGAPTGLVGTLTVGIEDADTGTTISAASTASITEPRSGKYKATRTSPSTAGDYFVVWTNAGTTVIEELTVTTSLAARVTPPSGGLLSGGQIAAMRVTAERALPGTCVIQNFSEVSDGAGGVTQTWTAAGTVSCRVAPLTGSEREEGERLTTESNTVITLPAETSITTRSRVVEDGVTYDVHAVRERSQEITRRVEAEKVDG